MTSSLLARALTWGLASSLSLLGPGSGALIAQPDGLWTETRFQTGCDPGPSREPPPPEHLQTHFPPFSPTAAWASLELDLDRGPSSPPTRPILGAGFNFEHALWSCPEFRSLFRSEILDPFKPAIARVDTGLLPAAPEDLPPERLGPDIYVSMLDSAPYAQSWAFFRRLNRAGVKIVLGVWGGPPQFTDDGTRLGVLLPRYYDNYVEYVATVVDYLVQRQHIDIWATTIANEPDGGDGNQIPPSGLAYIAHQLAGRLASDGVKLYGPDTANGADALNYIPLLLDDPLIAENLAFIAFHQYYPSPEVDSVVESVRTARPDLPVVITEYTSFAYGDLDAGQEANAQNAFSLDIAATLLSHFRRGVDAAVYWDAVDYLQPGHEAITRWGLLRGPTDDFQRRARYYGLLQILPYLQPGSVVLEDSLTGDDQLHSLGIRTADGVPAVFLVNQDFAPIDLTLQFRGADGSRYPEMSVTRTERGRFAEPIGRMPLTNGVGRLMLSPRSITTLFPAGYGPPVDDANS